MTARSFYKITHDWGNPREPEYRNGLLVSGACYEEGNLCLCFKVVGNRLPHSQDVRWILEVPRNARHILGERWSERSEIFKRVTDYLEQLDFGDDPLMADRKYVGLAVDMSKVPGWLPTKLKAVEKHLAPVSSRLPTMRVFLLFLLGLTIGYINRHNSSWISKEIAAMALLALGTISLALLFRETRDSYEVIKGCCAWASIAKKNYSWRLQALKMLVNVMGARIATTSGLALLLLYIGWNVA